MAEDQAPQTAGGDQPLAHFRYGVYNQPGPYVGRKIKDVRKQLGRVWSVQDDSPAYKGKEKLDDEYVVQEGDNIEFHKRQGEKGTR